MDGFALPAAHPLLRVAAAVRGRDSRWMTVELAALVVRTAKTLNERTGAPALVMGDASTRDGGTIKRHASHRSGRDIDLLFYRRDMTGALTTAERFRRFGGDGRCLNAKGVTGAKRCTLRFDDRLNWWVVRTLVASEAPAVQWIFVSTPLRKRLLAFAETSGEHPEILARARKVMKQPTGSSAHDDHFHVRIACSKADRAEGCRDPKPHWPWVDRATGEAAPITR